MRCSSFSSVTKKSGLMHKLMEVSFTEMDSFSLIVKTAFEHTWYLSPAPPAVLVEKKSVMWKKFPHNRLSCGENIHMTDCHVESYLHMVNVETNLSNGGIFHMKICHFEKFLHMTDFFSTSTACGACDKYQVWCWCWSWGVSSGAAAAPPAGSKTWGIQEDAWPIWGRHHL